MTYLRDFLTCTTIFIHTVNKVWRRNLRTCHQCHCWKVGNSNLLNSKISKGGIIFLLMSAKVAPLSTSPTLWTITCYHAFLVAVIYLPHLNQMTRYLRVFILMYSLFGKMSATALMVFPCLSIHQSDRGKLWQTFPTFQG